MCAFLDKIRNVFSFLNPRYEENDMEVDLHERLSGIERSLESILLNQADLMVMVRDVIHYARIDYFKDRKRDEGMARTLDDAIASIRKLTTLADGLIEQNKTLREQVKAVAGPEAQAKIDDIFDEAEAQAEEIAAAMQENVNPAPAGSGGGATSKD